MNNLEAAKAEPSKYFAVCWLHDGRRICGWSIHPDADTAKNITVEQIRDNGGSTLVHQRTGQVYRVEIIKEDFDEDMFMAMLTHGFTYFEEENPWWLQGSNSTTSKILT